MKPKEIKLTTKDLETPWFQDLEKTKEIEQIANKINNMFPNDYLVSSGNSFAWILKTLETKYPNRTKDIKYLPLSDRLNFSYQDFGKKFFDSPILTRTFIIDPNSELRTPNSELRKSEKGADSKRT